MMIQHWDGVDSTFTLEAFRSVSGRDCEGTQLPSSHPSGWFTQIEETYHLGEPTAYTPDAT
jgi:hypothetical protein